MFVGLPICKRPLLGIKPLNPIPLKVVILYGLFRKKMILLEKVIILDKNMADAGKNLQPTVTEAPER